MKKEELIIALKGARDSLNIMVSFLEAGNGTQTKNYAYQTIKFLFDAEKAANGEDTNHETT